MATNGNRDTSNGSACAFDSSSTVPLFLDGKPVTTKTTFEITSPGTNKVVWKASSASEEDALAAIKSAEKAFQTWSKTKPSARRDIFLKAADLLLKRKEECRAYSVTETGVADSMFEFEFNLAVELCKHVAGLIPTIQGSIPSPSEEGKSAMVIREPYGVILGIAPWNAPYILGMRACVGPLAAGNTVILKGPEAAPAVYWSFVDTLHKAGLPPGCLNTIYHQPSDAAKITNTIISHPAIRKVNFTGSTAVGSIIASLAGKHLKPVLMELGGKAPSIVCEDADISNAALQCALGAFLHGGQICMSTERIIVHAAIADKFKDALRATMDQVFGASTPAPTLVNAPPVAKNKKLIQDALSKGAKTVYGDAAAEEDSKTRMRPVIIENINKDMDIYHTESFGPTVALYTVQTDEEALEIANDTDYGLAAAVFTEDLRRGLRIAKGIETGAVHINSMTVHDEAILPHGGAKKSGFGRFNSREGMEEWVRTKTITWKD